MAGFQAEPAQVIEHPATQDGKDQKVLAQILSNMLSVEALRQKTLIAASRLFTLLLSASVFLLAWKALASPDYLKIVVLGLYGCFIIAIHLVKRRE